MTRSWLLQSCILEWRFIPEARFADLASLIVEDASLPPLVRAQGFAVLAWHHFTHVNEREALRCLDMSQHAYASDEGDLLTIRRAAAAYGSFLRGNLDDSHDQVMALLGEKLPAVFEARLQVLLGRILLKYGNLEQAEEGFDAAKYLSRTAGDGRLEAMAFVQLGILCMIRSEYDVATAYFTRAIELLERNGERSFAARAVYNRMLTLRKVGLIAKAAQEMELLASRSKEIPRTPRYLNEFARLHLALEDQHEVRKHLAMIEQATDEHTPIRSRVITREVHADFHKLKGEWTKALKEIDAGLELAYGISEQNDLVGELLRRRARALYELGRDDEAFAAAKRSLEVCERVGEVYEIGALFRTLGLLAERRYDYADPAYALAGQHR